MAEVALYEREPFRRELTIEVLRADTEDGRPFVVLADTICYPEGGGQPGDRGRIAGIAITEVRRVGEEVRHYLAGPPPSGQVRAELDWERRFDHMQQHTGQHLLTAIAQERFGWATTAFHLGESVSDIELDTSGIDPELLQALEEMVAAEIRAVRPVTAWRVSPEEYAVLPVRTRGLPDGHRGDIRLVEIAGIDLNTCGGTHLSSTAEIEALKLLGTEPMRGGTRLFYVAGGRLRRLLAAHHERSARLRQIVGAADEELAAGIQAKLDQLKEAQRTIRTLAEDLAIETARAMAAGADRVSGGHWPARDLQFLQGVAKELVRRAPDRIALLTTGEDEQGAFLLCAGEGVAIDLAAAGRKVAEILGGRGGGSGRIFQGKASTLSRRDEALGWLSTLA